jgi:hypothetical protein
MHYHHAALHGATSLVFLVVERALVYLCIRSPSAAFQVSSSLTPPLDCCPCRCGQFYCTPCSRHFADDATLELHKTSKPHKRRCV